VKKYYIESGEKFPSGKVLHKSGEKFPSDVPRIDALQSAWILTLEKVFHREWGKIPHF